MTKLSEIDAITSINANSLVYVAQESGGNYNSSRITANNLFASPRPIGSTTPSTGAFTTLSASSTVSGVGFSTYLASPPSIGSTVANSGAFTTLSASGVVSGVGFSNYLASPPAIGSSSANTGRFTTLTATTALQAPSSAGILIEASNGTGVGLLGVGNSANVTWYGGHTMTTLTASTSLSTPRINDTNGNELIEFVTTASAVNHFQITNRGTGLAPIFAAVGDDANININFLTKGTGTYVFNGTSTSQAKISIREQTTNGNNGIILQTAAAVTSDKTWTLPEGDVANGVWLSNGSGVLTTQRPVFAEGFFDGTAVTPSFAYQNNFSGIVDNGTGTYALTFTSAQANTNYVVTGSATTGVAGQENDVFGVDLVAGRLTTSIGIKIRDCNANAWADNNGIYVSVGYSL